MYKLNSDLSVSDTCVTVIFVIPVVLLIVPSLLNFGISDHFVFVQAEPVQYRVKTPVLKLSEFVGKVIAWLPSTVIGLLTPFKFTVNVGIVTKVLNLITILLERIDCSYIPVILFLSLSETKYL